jgi:peptidylprolyl isomerase
MRSILRHFLVATTLLSPVLLTAPGSLSTAFAAGPAAPANVNSRNYTTTSSGLQFASIRVGEGPAVQKGQVVSVHYTGWLENGEKFDSSFDRNKPFQFKVGEGKVIKGWDEGVAGMKKGEVRQLKIPANLGYGARGAGSKIPPNAPLVFQVELLDIVK